MELYVKGKSKKALNDKLVLGGVLYGEDYSIFGGGSHKLDNKLPSGTVIKIFEGWCCGNPVAKSYGVWSSTKCRIR